MIYIQSILYHLKLYWNMIALVILAIATVILLIIYANTNNTLFAYLALTTALCATVMGCVLAEPHIAEVLDTMGLLDTPEDEEERSINNAN